MGQASTPFQLQHSGNFSDANYICSIICNFKNKTFSQLSLYTNPLPSHELPTSPRWWPCNMNTQVSKNLYMLDAKLPQLDPDEELPVMLAPVAGDSYI